MNNKKLCPECTIGEVSVDDVEQGTNTSCNYCGTVFILVGTALRYT